MTVRKIDLQKASVSSRLTDTREASSIEVQKFKSQLVQPSIYLARNQAYCMTVRKIDLQKASVSSRLTDTREASSIEVQKFKSQLVQPSIYLARNEHSVTKTYWLTPHSRSFLEVQTYWLTPHSRSFLEVQEFRSQLVQRILLTFFIIILSPKRTGIRRNTCSNSASIGENFWREIEPHRWCVSRFSQQNISNGNGKATKQGVASHE
jgi:hypothetical protein